MRFRLFSVGSLKEKRSMVKHILNFIRKKHNVSISEIGAQDSKSFLEIGVAMVAGSSSIIHNTFEEIASYIELREGLELEEMEKEIW